MSRTFPFFLATVILVSLSACGRKADLEKPSAMPAPENGQKVTEPVEDKPFVLDGLIK
jgi:predicted small lipoprotein YifL